MEYKGQWQKKWGKLIDPDKNEACGDILLDVCWGIEERELND
jgi:hypothetical protein